MVMFAFVKGGACWREQMKGRTMPTGKLALLYNSLAHQLSRNTHLHWPWEMYGYQWWREFKFIWKETGSWDPCHSIPTQLGPPSSCPGFSPKEYPRYLQICSFKLFLRLCCKLPCFLFFMILSERLCLLMGCNLKASQHCFWWWLYFFKTSFWWCKQAVESSVKSGHLLLNFNSSPSNPKSAKFQDQLLCSCRDPWSLYRIKLLSY